VWFQIGFATMSSSSTQNVMITVADQPVSGLLQVPQHACACYVLAHGAGAGMAHPFMAATANGLAEREIATLRYQFPYMERAQSGLTFPNWFMPRYEQQCKKPLV